MEERLYDCLCPGQGRYTSDKAAELAARLREVAASLEQRPAPERVVHVEERDSKRRRKELRGRATELDFGAYQQRYVALELLYLGHSYDGFARQETTDETIEGHLFSALRLTRLISPHASWQELRYSRGGRTDKGVSALNQVVALLLRSTARASPPPTSGQGPAEAGQGEGQGGGEAAASQLPDPEAELDYPALLNRVLPKDIRVLGWTDVPEEFSARFSAQFREYKYLIAHGPPPAGLPAHAAAAAQAGEEGSGAPAAGDGTEQALDAEQAGQAAQGGQQAGQQAGQAAPGAPLDVERMRQAAASFLGEHDFRNFCKMDLTQVQNFRRTVLDFRVETLPGCGWGGRALLQLHIRGTAFLWHQVRCMAAVLMMVGRGEEEPGIVQRLLDTAATPRKPQYMMASEEPLLLYSCTYDGLNFRRTPANYAVVCGQLEDMLTSHLIRAGMLHTIQAKLAGDGVALGGSSSGKLQRGNGGKHVPLLLRSKEPAVEERMLKLKGARAAAEEPLDGGSSGGSGSGNGAAGAVTAGAVPARTAVPAGRPG